MELFHPSSMRERFVGYYRDKRCVVETNDHKVAQMLCIATFALQNPREPIKAWDVIVMMEK
jgi:hypothetical protein